MNREPNKNWLLFIATPLPRRLVLPPKHAHPARTRSFRRGGDRGTVGAVVRVLFVVPGHAGPHHGGVEVDPIRAELGHRAPVAVFLNAHERHLPVAALDRWSQVVPALGN